MILYFIYSATKVAAKFHDHIASRLVVLYFVRSWAWFLGAVSTALTTYPARGGKSRLRSICFVSPEYWPLSGGTGAYVYYLANELIKNAYNIYVVTGSNQTLDVQVNPNLKVFFLQIPKTPIIKSFLLAGSSEIEN